jgi:hypothetical protein
MGLDPRLVMGVMVNETRGWAKYGQAGLSAEDVISEIKNTVRGNMFRATVGPAQLGLEAREVGAVGHLEAKTFTGAIKGAVNYLGRIKAGLVSEGVVSPTNAQIASRYNAALRGFPAGTVTKYGLQVDYIINNRLYAGK